MKIHTTISVCIASFILGGVVVNYFADKEITTLREKCTKLASLQSVLSKTETGTPRNCRLKLIKNDIKFKTEILKYLVDQRERNTSFDTIIEKSAIGLKRTIYINMNKIESYPNNKFKENTMRVLNEGIKYVEQIETESY